MIKKSSSISNTTDRSHIDNSQMDMQEGKIPHCNQNSCFSGLDLRIKNNDSSSNELEDL